MIDWKTNMCEQVAKAFSVDCGKHMYECYGILNGIHSNKVFVLCVVKMHVCMSI